MKKISQRLLAAAVVAAVGVSASADVLSPEQALGRALPQARRAAPALSQPVLAYTAEAAELPAVYVFAKENKGFLLVSADDAVAPLLGYSDAGNFDADNMNPAFEYWIGEYARQIAYVRENNLESGKPRISRAPRAAIAPLVKTTWNQMSPYNLLCPTYNGVHLPTGCVATAAAQIVKYHEYPAQWKGQIVGDCGVQGVSMQLTMDLDETPLEWDKMLDSYTSANPGTAEQQNAVATLMTAIGYGVDMNYAAAGSGAQTIMVSKLLCGENFGYDKSVQYLQRDCYTQDEWENIIYDQLARKLPVLYDGSTINEEGHAYVCDGYQENDGNAYFHINWGWGGTSDGYFMLGVLDPDMQGTGGAASGQGFNYGQDATINIMPDQGGEGVPSFTAQGNGLLITPEAPATFNLGREVTVAYDGGGFYNHSYLTLSGYYGLHIVGEGQDFYRWCSTPFTELGTNFGTRGYGVLLSGVKENSTYVLTPVFRVGDKIYDMGLPYGKVRSYLLKTSVSNGTLIPIGTTLDVTEVVLTDANGAAVENVKKNNRMYMKGRFSNSGDTYYYGHAAVVLLDKVYGEFEVLELVNNFTLNVAPGEEEEFSQLIRFTSGLGLKDNHDYYFGFMDPETSNILGSLYKFHFGTVSGINDITDDASAVTLYPNPAESYFTVQGAEVSEVNVYSLAGVLAAKAADATVDVADLAAGLYLVEVVDTEGNRTTVRLIKK